MRRGYQDLAAKGLMTCQELGEKLGQVEECARWPSASWRRYRASRSA
jgi:hypothetical protein